MRFVLDSCVAFKWHLVESNRAQAVRLRTGFLQGTAVLLAPDVFPVEVAHSLTRAERQGRITPAEGIMHIRDMLTTLPDLHPSLLLLPRAYELSSQFRIGVYDCLYVALAEREGCALVTADDRLVRALQPTYPFITALASLP